MKIILPIFSLFLIFSCSQSVSSVTKNEVKETEALVNEVEGKMNTEFYRDSIRDYSKLSEDEWKDILTSKEYYILREKGTERAFLASM